MVPADEDDGLMTSVIRYAPKSNGLDGRKADVLFAECTSGQDYTNAVTELSSDIWYLWQDQDPEDHELQMGNAEQLEAVGHGVRCPRQRSQPTSDVYRMTV